VSLPNRYICMRSNIIKIPGQTPFSNIFSDMGGGGLWFGVCISHRELFAVELVINMLWII